MKKGFPAFVAFIIIFTLVFPSFVFAHSGRTDSNGGHNCSAKSISKGLCSGYHYHNGGSSGSKSSSKTKNGNSNAVKKVKLIENEYPPYSYCKKIKDKYLSTDSYFIYYERIWDCNRYTDSGDIYTILERVFYVDNTYQSLQQKFISVKDTSYIYVRDFAKATSFSIEIDKSKNVVLKKGSIILKINAQTRKIDYNGKYTGFNAVKAEGNYYLPLRASLKWAGYDIKSIDSKSIKITSS